MSEGKLTMDKLAELSEKINNYRPPAGIVMSCQVKDVIEQQSKQTEIDQLFGDILPKATFGGVNVYPFEDVPNDKSIVFYDRDKLVEYLQAREDGNNHFQSLGEVLVNNDSITEKDIDWAREIIEERES